MSLPDDLSLPARDVLDALSIDEESTELLRDFVEGRDRSLVEAALQELVAHGLVERATREEEFFAAALADPDALDDATRRTYLGP